MDNDDCPTMGSEPPPVVKDAALVSAFHNGDATAALERVRELILERKDVERLSREAAALWFDYEGDDPHEAAKSAKQSAKIRKSPRPREVGFALRSLDDLKAGELGFLDGLSLGILLGDVLRDPPDKKNKAAKVEIAAAARKAFPVVSKIKSAKTRPEALRDYLSENGPALGLGEEAMKLINGGWAAATWRKELSNWGIQKTKNSH